MLAPAVGHVIAFGNLTAPAASALPAAPSSAASSTTWTPAVWVQLGIGVLTVVVAFFVMRNGFRSTTKVDQAARRTEWWKRTQWAIDLALDPEERKQEVGVLALNQLLDSELARQDDRDVANAVMAALVLEADVDSDESDDEAATGSSG